MEQRVTNLGIVGRRCASCGEQATLRLLETTDVPRRGWAFWRAKPTGSSSVTATCSSCGRTYAARAADAPRR